MLQQKQLKMSPWVSHTIIIFYKGNLKCLDMSVKKSDKKPLIFASLISPAKIILFEEKYQAFDMCFIIR